MIIIVIIIIIIIIMIIIIISSIVIVIANLTYFASVIAVVIFIIFTDLITIIVIIIIHHARGRSMVESASKKVELNLLSVAEHQIYSKFITGIQQIYFSRVLTLTVRIEHPRTKTFHTPLLLFGQVNLNFHDRSVNSLIRVCISPGQLITLITLIRSAFRQ
jgi:hypothetical protein